MNRFTHYAATAVAAAGLAVAPLVAAGAASASSVDDTFLADISRVGIGYDSPEAAIDGAFTVCAMLDDGESTTTIGNDILSNSDLTELQAAVLVIASVHAYCPEYGS
jgi:Protein of unknown function (DUF732)